MIKNNYLNSKQLTKLIVEEALNAKGTNISILDVKDVFSLSDYFIIISGRSDRHVQGIVNRIESYLRQNNQEPLNVEGKDKAHWVLMDYENVLVHVFYDNVRDNYDLESLWIKSNTIEPKDLGIVDVDQEAA